jgi:hypothetical protein
VSGLVIAGVGAVLCASALGIDDAVRPAVGLGPATLPTALSTLLIITGLVLAATGGVRTGRRPVPYERALHFISLTGQVVLP